MFWSNLLRDIIGWLDSIVYGFIDNVYITMTNLASYTLINSEIITTFTQRIYILVGVFMLFKMSFSLINYFIDPDKLTDSKTGFGNLVQRIVISLVMLVLVPTIFELAFYAQTLVLKENILANLILGGTYDDIETEEFATTYENAGKQIPFTIMNSFLYPKETAVMSMTEKEIQEEFGDEEELYTSYAKYKEAQANNDTGQLLGWGSIKNDVDSRGNYIYSYTPIISTLAGALTLWIFFVFCIDIGVRIVKLVVLQLLAPIPILSYMDANKGKDIFNRWVKECFSTYAGLFIKLLVVYFVIFIIALISKNGFTIYQYDIKDGNLVTNPLHNVDLLSRALIILGLLIFATEAPKLITDMFGINAGDFSLNPMKRIGKSALGSAFIGGLAGGATGGVMGAYGNYHANRQMGKGRMKSALSGAAGVVSGTRRGAVGGATQKNFSGMLGKGKSVAGINSARLLEKANTGTGAKGMWSRGVARAQTSLGMQTKGDRSEKQLKSYTDFSGNMSKLKDAAGKRLNKEALQAKHNVSGFKYGDGKVMKESMNIGEQRALVDTLKSVDVSKLEEKERLEFPSKLANEQAKLAAGENAAKKEIMKDMTAAYMKGSLQDIDDSDAVAALTAMQDAINDEPSWYSGMEYEDKDDKGKAFTATYDASDALHTTKDAVEDRKKADAFVEKASKAAGSEASKTSTSLEYKQATATRDYAKSISGSSKK